MDLLLIITFFINTWSFILLLLLVSFLRSTMNRIKFDELMNNAWINILPLLFYLLFLCFML
jgi:NADH:ubiquinone oxidoreductase subunit H